MIIVIDPYSKQGSFGPINDIRHAAKVHVDYGRWNSPVFMDIPPEMSIYDKDCILEMLTEEKISYEIRPGREMRLNDYDSLNTYL